MCMRFISSFYFPSRSSLCEFASLNVVSVNRMSSERFESANISLVVRTSVCLYYSLEPQHINAAPVGLITCESAFLWAANGVAVGVHRSPKEGLDGVDWCEGGLSCTSVHFDHNPPVRHALYRRWQAVDVAVILSSVWKSQNPYSSEYHSTSGFVHPNRISLWHH